ncbi:hypothetical protein [Streptomyces sp. RerS4]|nr:hypothetical protein [Streptomyces sp. RerS4]
MTIRTGIELDAIPNRDVPQEEHVVIVAGVCDRQTFDDQPRNG